MAVKSKEDLKALFQTNDKPNQQDFADLIDSLMQISENGSNDITNQSEVTGNTTSDALNNLEEDKAASDHNHNLANLAERSYSSLTDRPDLIIPTKASDLDNDSDVTGTKVSDALNELKSDKAAADHNHNLNNLAEKNYSSLNGTPNLSGIRQINTIYNCESWGDINIYLNELKTVINSILSAFNE